MDLKNKEYHVSLIVENDVYETVGTQVFDKFDRSKKIMDSDNLESNLLVVSKKIYDGLVDSVNPAKLRSPRDFRISKKVDPVLSSIDDLLSSSNFEDMNKDIAGTQFQFVEYTSGLDILLVDTNLDDSELVKFVTDNFSFKELKPKQREKNPKISFVSSTNHKRSALRKSGLPVSQVDFLVGDLSILQKSVTSSTPELEALVYQKKKIPYDDFKKSFNDERIISVNMLVELNHNPQTPDIENYAIVKSKKMNRDKYGKILTVSDKKENLFLERIKIDENNWSLDIAGTKSPYIYGVNPWNSLQYIAVNALLDPDVSCVFLVGGAGTGKTLFSYLAGIYQTAEYSAKHFDELRWDNPFHVEGIKNSAQPLKNRLHKRSVLQKEGRSTMYENFYLLKADIPQGDHYQGFKKGTTWEKTQASLKAFEDAHKISTLRDKFTFQDLVLNPHAENMYGKQRGELKKFEYGGQLSQNKEHFDLTTYDDILGRSLQNAYIVIDEVQEFTPAEVSKILTRAGAGSKVVLCGDPTKQVTRAGLNQNYNGMIQSIEHFIGKDYSAVINFGEAAYRSEVADDAMHMDF